MRNEGSISENIEIINIFGKLMNDIFLQPNIAKIFRKNLKRCRSCVIMIIVNTISALVRFRTEGNVCKLCSVNLSFIRTDVVSVASQQTYHFTGFVL